MADCLPSPPDDLRGGENLVPLRDILLTDKLTRRPSRPPDYATETRALGALVQALADSPSTILQTLADTVLELLRADSAGLSLLTRDGERFYWAAIAGAWQPHLGGGTPRDFGPCGDVLDCNAPLLFTRWERRYRYLAAATPLAEEGLLAPFHVNGKAVGTIWMIAHTHDRKFDAEDLRQLESLGRFASAAWQSVELRHAEESRRALEKLNENLRESEERYRTLFELGPVAVYSCDASGAIQTFNRRAAELWGRLPNTGAGGERFSGAHKLYWADGSPLAHDKGFVAQVLGGRPEAREAEVIVERPDGSRRTVVAHVRPLRNRRGDIAGAINCFYDITERKQDELRQQLLIDELNHRVKNTLATVQSIARHTLASSDDGERRKAFDARLIALSRTHDLLARARWESASLRELIRQELAPFQGVAGPSCVADGPDLRLRPKMALALGFAFHELATNAAKYGALSRPGGEVRVTWNALDGAALRLRWAESGGPPVAPVTRKGFGLTVIERGVSLELDGTVALDFDPKGLVCDLEIPLAG